MKKIVYCIAGTYRSGGMERVLANKANYLVAHGYEVTVVTTDQRGQKPFFPLDSRIACIDLGIDYELNNGKSIWHKLAHYPAKQRRHKKKLTALLNRLKADVVVSMFCNDASFITRINDGSKKVLEIHFSKFKRLQYGRSGLWRLADEWRSRQDEKNATRFHRFVVLTEEDKTYWGNLPNIQVIPNALTFNPQETAPLNNKKALAVGRFTHQKGFDMLIDAWRHVCRNNAEWQLEIVGDGELKEALQQQIDRYGIGARVTLSPPTDNMPQKYMDASVLVLTSRYEGLPMILLEAQSFGLPIAAFACKCGPKDVVSNASDGFLVSEGDTATLAEKLLTVMNDEALRKKMGKEAKISSLRYSEEKIMTQWVDLFKGISK